MSFKFLVAAAVFSLVSCASSKQVDDLDTKVENLRAEIFWSQLALKETSQNVSKISEHLQKNGCRK